MLFRTLPYIATDITVYPRLQPTTQSRGLLKADTSCPFTAGSRIATTPNWGLAGLEAHFSNPVLITSLTIQSLDIFNQYVC